MSSIGCAREEELYEGEERGEGKRQGNLCKDGGLGWWHIGEKQTFLRPGERRKAKQGKEERILQRSASCLQ